MKRPNMKIKGLLAALFAFAFTAALSLGNDWDEQPSVLRSVAPENPKKIEGMVTAIVVIGADGKVMTAEIDKSTDSALEDPVLQALQKWRFNPAKKNNQPVEATIKIPFRFRS